MRLAIAIGALLAPAVLAAGLADADAAKPKKREKLICVTVKETGSRLARHNVCMTRKQWQEQRQEVRDAIQRGQTKQATNPTG
jgi:D-aminopeptidase